MKLIHLYSLFIVLCASITALAGDIYEINTSFRIRHSQQFGKNTKNVTAYAQAGFQFEVLSRLAARNGAEILQIKPLDSKANLAKLNVIRRNGKMYIYKKRNSTLFKMIKDDPNQDVANCSRCNEGAAMDTPKNLDQIADVAGEINEQEEVGVPSFNGSFDALIKKYVASKEVENMNKYALGLRPTKGEGWCLRGTKEVMQCGGRRPCLMNYKFQANPAPDALRALNNTKGFVNLLTKEPYKSQLKADPSKAPKGTVLIYSSGKPCSPIYKGKKVVGYKFKDCGHAEVKAVDAKGNDFYVSDYKDDVPRPVAGGSRYKLIGAFIKDL